MITQPIELVVAAFAGFMILRAIESIIVKMGKSIRESRKKREVAKKAQLEALLDSLEKRLAKRKKK